MRFRTRGTMTSEAVVDVASRVVATLQDAGVERVAGVNLYLTVIDKKGAERTLEVGGELVESWDVPCADLIVPDAPKRLQVARQGAPSARRRSGAQYARRKTKSA